MNEATVRRVMTNLQNDFSAHPELLKRFSSTPRIFLQSYGLPMGVQKQLALEGDPSAPAERCLCGSYLSVLTTIIKTGFQPEQNPD